MSNLYQAALLAHAKKPYGAKTIPSGTEDGEAINTGCGDEIRVSLSWTSEGCLEHLTYELHGCAVSTAAASMVAHRLEGRTCAEITAMTSAFRARLGEKGFEEEWGDFQALNGIEQFPARIHCATLVWKAIEQALSKSEATRS